MNYLNLEASRADSNLLCALVILLLCITVVLCIDYQFNLPLQDNFENF